MSPFFVQFVFLTILAPLLNPVWTHMAHFPFHLCMQVFHCFFFNFWAPPGRVLREVGGAGGTPLNRINSTLPLSLFFKNHTRPYTNSPKGFFWKPAAGFKGCRLCRRPNLLFSIGAPGGAQNSMENWHAQMRQKVTHMRSNWLQKWSRNR